MDNLLSERAKVSRDTEDFLYKTLSVCNKNPYHERDNPNGFINFGTAINNMCNDVLHPKLDDIWKCDFDSLGYKEGHGTIKLRSSIARLMTEFLESHKPVSPDNLFCVTGVTSCIDLLGHCLAEPGEVFLVPTPIYGRIYTDFIQRSLVELWPVHLITEDDEDGNAELTLEKIICAHESALVNKLEVRGIFLINPNNPLGDVYSPKLLMDIMSFCTANSLHLIVDELYALSVFSETENFHSILKFSQIPDPDRTHVLYGLSKDFGIAGVRVGVIHTKCKDLQKSLMQLSYFHSIPYPVMEIVVKFVEDLDWCKNFISVHQKRLAENYKYCVEYLKSIEIKVRECPAGFFLWVDLRHLCNESFKKENDLFNHILQSENLYIGPGEQFYCAQPGWFRIVFTQSRDHLKEGLRRLKVALRNYK